MEQYFITKIQITKVRHLENIAIPLADGKRMHLILTGKNGSGKTSVLEEIRKHILTLKDAFSIGIKIKDIESLSNAPIDNIVKRVKTDKVAIETQLIIQKTTELRKSLDIKWTPKIDIRTIIFFYFPAKHSPIFQQPEGSKSIEKEGNLGQYFVQYIINLRNARSFAFENNDKQAVEKAEKWLQRLENILKDIFDDKTLKLDFYIDTYDSHILKTRIITKNREVFDFHTLSDGYGAVIDIISEILMQMEMQHNVDWDCQGLVLIDEIETHLHIDLQKKILPFLTSFFPNIQFIVTTHSPFVLNSIEDAVIFDLENNIRVEDLSAYSVSGIVESYFNNDNYSLVALQKLKDYENLVKKTTVSEDEKEVLYDLRKFLRKIPSDLAPELVLKFQQIEFSRLGK